jgi:hypothetical protein
MLPLPGDADAAGGASAGAAAVRHFSWARRLMGHIPTPMLGSDTDNVALCAKCGSVQMYFWRRPR